VGPVCEETDNSGVSGKSYFSLILPLTGMRIALFLKSEEPASTTRTFFLLFADNLFARTHPAVPPPTIM